MEPTCFGLYWEHIPGSDCTKDGGCSLEGDCLARFARHRLFLLQENNPDATPEKLAELTSVKVEAIHQALKFQRNTGIVPNPVPAPPTPAAAEPEVIAPPDAATEWVAEAPEAPAELAKAISEAAAENEAERKRRKNPPRGKDKKPRKKRGGNPVNFPVAGPAQNAVGPAQLTMTKSANVVWGAERPWSPKQNRARWERERLRCPLIAQLEPGMRLIRRYQGIVHEIQVCKYHYLLDQGTDQYPTLYAVMIAITGLRLSRKQRRENGVRPRGKKRTPTQSAPRFFRLSILLQKQQDKQRVKS